MHLAYRFLIKTEKFLSDLHQKSLPKASTITQMTLYLYCYVFQFIWSALMVNET